MVFLSTFFAYDSAKAQLKKTNLTKSSKYLNKNRTHQGLTFDVSDLFLCDIIVSQRDHKLAVGAGDEKITRNGLVTEGPEIPKICQCNPVPIVECAGIGDLLQLRVEGEQAVAYGLDILRQMNAF